MNNTLPLKKNNDLFQSSLILQYRKSESIVDILCTVPLLQQAIGCALMISSLVELIFYHLQMVMKLESSRLKEITKLGYSIKQIEGFFLNKIIDIQNITGKSTKPEMLIIQLKSHIAKMTDQLKELASFQEELEELNIEKAGVFNQIRAEMDKYNTHANLDKSFYNEGELISWKKKLDQLYLSHTDLSGKYTEYNLKAASYETVIGEIEQDLVIGLNDFTDLRNSLVAAIQTNNHEKEFTELNRSIGRETGVSKRIAAIDQNFEQSIKRASDTDRILDAVLEREQSYNNLLKVLNNEIIKLRQYRLAKKAVESDILNFLLGLGRAIPILGSVISIYRLFSKKNN